MILIPVPRHQVGKYLKRQYKRALRVDYNAGALDRWKSNWYKSLCWLWIILFSLVVIRQDIPYPTQTFQSQEGNILTCTICVFVIMLQFTVHIQNIHVGSKTINCRPENLLSNRIDRAPRSQRVARAQVLVDHVQHVRIEVSFWTRNFKNKLFEFMQVVRNLKLDPHPVKMLLQVPRSHQQQVKKRKLVFLQSSPDYCRCKHKISQKLQPLHNLHFHDNQDERDSWIQRGGWEDLQNWPQQVPFYLFWGTPPTYWAALRAT